MLLLSLDTSGKHGSIALLREAALLELVSLAGGTYSAQLIPQISALLARHGFDKRALDAFAVASGPGSFTGLRVGLSTVKALAEVLRKPIAAVSLLEALAWTAQHGSETRATQVIAALDAGRKQVFLGEYMLRPGTLPKLLREAVLGTNDFVAELQARMAGPVVTSDPGLAAEAQKHGLAVRPVAPVDAGVIARLGAQKLAAGLAISPEALEANYIRRSDAEIFSKSH